MKPLDPAWATYAPNDRQPWNMARVAHLHRRAGFGGTWGELQHDLRDGPTTSIKRFLDGRQTMHEPANFAHLANLLGEAAVNSGEIGRLKAWWCYRMLFTPDPLTEKMTLLWHNHFATGFAKVLNVGLMKRQNDVFRQHALGSFTTLLNESIRQPALLEYLDAPSNRKGHPNENLAREVMELFTLGVGHYTEAEVKEAARCLTGWTVNDYQFAEVNTRHDGGVKTLFGKTGTYNGSQLLKLLLDHPATAERIVFRLCELFMGEQATTPAMRASLAGGLRDRQYDLRWVVSTILHSQAFFDTPNLGTRIKSPVEYAIGAARQLELFDPAPSTLAMGDWCGRLGQDLFEPPNVGGWKGGRTWISARSMIARANYANALVEGQHMGRTQPYDPATLVEKHGVKASGNSLIDFHVQLCTGNPAVPALVARLSQVRGRGMIAACLACPEVQLG